MKSPGKFFSTGSIFILIIVGLIFSLFEKFQLFSSKENISLQKIISSKPNDIKDKQVLIESGVSTSGDFTFFDTLDDPSMKKYIGLNGSTISLEKEDSDRAKDSNLYGNRIRAPLTTLPVHKSGSISSVIDAKAPPKNNPSISGFAIQVGSFQDFQRANNLKNKLAKYDHPIFISSALLEKKEQALHRVFVGTFSAKKDAEK